MLRGQSRWSLIILCATTSVGLVHSSLEAQDRPQQWERRLEPVRPPLTAFHATQAINLPTAETLAGG